jgi:hypothetical protein
MLINDVVEDGKEKPSFIVWMDITLYRRRKRRYEKRSSSFSL